MRDIHMVFGSFLRNDGRVAYSRGAAAVPVSRADAQTFSSLPSQTNERMPMVGKLYHCATRQELFDHALLPLYDVRSYSPHAGKVRPRWNYRTHRRFDTLPFLTDQGCPQPRTLNGGRPRLMRSDCQDPVDLGCLSRCGLVDVCVALHEMSTRFPLLRILIF